MCKRRPAFWQTELSEFFMLYGIFHIFRKHVNILQNFLQPFILSTVESAIRSPSVEEAATSSPVAERWVILSEITFVASRIFWIFFFCRMDIFHQAFNGFTDIAEFLPCILNQFVLLFYGSN